MGDLDNTDDSDIEIKYDLLLMIESSEESSDDHYLIDKVRAWVEIDSKVAPSQNWINFSFLIPAKDLKGRWRNLRDTYKGEKAPKNTERTSSGQAEKVEVHGYHELPWSLHRGCEVCSWW